MGGFVDYGLGDLRGFGGLGAWDLGFRGAQRLLSFKGGSGFNALVSGSEIRGFGLGFGDLGSSVSGFHGLGSLAYWYERSRPASLNESRHTEPQNPEALNPAAEGLLYVRIGFSGI